MRLIHHGVGHYRSGMTIGACWPHHDIIVVLNGELALTVHGKAFRLVDGDAIVIPPHHRFEGEAASEEMTIWVLHFSDYQATVEGSAFDPATLQEGGQIIPQAVTRSLDRLLIHDFTQRWNGVEPIEGRSEEEKLEIRNERPFHLLAELLFSRFEEASSPLREAIPPRLKAVVAETLNGNLHFDVAKMAQLTGVCQSRFRQLFSKYYGISPIKFLLQSRMEKGRRLLSETSLPIKEISRIAGYGETAAFHHAFTREVGLSPGQYRKRHRGVI